jgi:hypothetical protein
MTTIRKHWIVRVVLFVSACGLAAFPSVTESIARPDFGVRGGAYTEEEEPFLGAEALFNLGPSEQWFGNPNVEHAFIQDGDLTSLSFDFHYDFPSNQPYTLWAGGGPTVLFRDQDASGNDDETDPGVNLLFGLGAKKGEVRPYGQMKVIVADDTQAVLGAGIRF